MNKTEFENKVNAIIASLPKEEQESAKTLFRKFEEFVEATEPKGEYKKPEITEELYTAVLNYVKGLDEGFAISTIQKAFPIGYAGAGAIKDRMEQEGLLEVKDMPNGTKRYFVK